MTGPTTDSTQYDIDRALLKKRTEVHNTVHAYVEKWKAAGSPGIDHPEGIPDEVLSQFATTGDPETDVAIKTALIAEQQAQQQAAIAAEQAVRQEQM